MAECEWCARGVPWAYDGRETIVGLHEHKHGGTFDLHVCKRGPLERELRAYYWGHGLDGLSDAAVDLYQGAHAGMLRRGLAQRSVYEIASEAIEAAAELGL